MRHRLHPLSLAGGLLAAWLAAAPAGAVTLNTTISGPPPLADIIATGSSGTVQSSYPDAINPLAQASASVARVTSSALGTGTQRLTGGYYASSGFGAYYQLWDPTHDVPVDATTAFPIKLQFNLRATGNIVAAPDEDSGVQAQLTATLDPDYPYLPTSTAKESINVLWSAAAGYSVVGNSAMNGSFDFYTHVWHSYAQAGFLAFTVFSYASGAGQTSLNLALDSVSLYSGGMPATGLSLRLDNGQFLPVDGSVSAVPEAPTWLMWCAAAGLAGVLRRRAA